MKHACLALIALASPAAADPATIESVEARAGTNGWTFSVTLRHPDTGWDDYADGWRVMTTEGKVLGTRVLAHPHVNEQPFTRSLGGVAVPEATREVVIESSTKPEGWSGEKVSFRLPE